MSTLVVNLYGGPGVGKSTACAGIFTELKLAGINCEMAREFAKDIVWEESFKVLENQMHVFGQQQHRIYRLIDQVDVIITDAPLLLSLVYGQKMPPVFKGMVLQEFEKYNNYNVFLQRNKPYNPSGRIQTEEEAKEKDVIVYHMLKANGIEFEEWISSRNNINNIAEKIKDMI